MAIIRTARPTSYTNINNDVFIDNNGLSWESMGLLCYLISKPDCWEVSPAALANTKKCGINKVHSLLKELRNSGFVVGKRTKIGTFDYYVYDTKQSNTPHQEKPHQEKPDKEKPHQELSRQVTTDNKQILIKSINTDKSKSIRDKSRQDKIEKTKRGVFKIPELQEVCRLIADESLSLDAAAFINFYESKGWFIGKSKMKDWKAAARGWSSRNTQKNLIERNQSGLIQINSGLNSNAYNNTNYRKQSTSELQLAACQRAIEREEREQQCRNTEN